MNNYDNKAQVSESNENRVVTIPLDEYFDLRNRAEMNGMLMVQLGELQGRLGDFDRRIWELENELHGKVT
jgi:hypothetical protein